MVWTALQKYSSMFIQFCSGIILARLLAPSDYGCIGMLAIFMSLADALIDGGFGSALIQKKNPTQVDYSTIFFWNMGMAVVMYAILYACAPAIARFYKIDVLCPVLRVQALVLFIHAFNLIQKNQLRKNLNFKLLSIVTIVTSLISLGVTVIMAYKGFGVWSLVAQNLITNAVPAVVFWFYVKWRPMWAFSKESFKELFGFGFYMFLTHLVNKFSGELTGLIIGKVYSPSTMGFFSKAKNTERLASHSISSVMTQVTYPLFAKVQDNKQSLTNMIKRMTMTITFVTLPLMVVLILIAKPLFILLYSAKWAPSIPYFQALCLAGFANCISGVNLQPIAAVGKSKAMFVWTVIKRTAGLSFMISGLLIAGMKGLVIGSVINSWFSMFVNQCLVSRHIGYKFSQQWKDLYKVFAATVCCGLFAWTVGHFAGLSMYWDALLKTVIMLATYMAWAILTNNESFVYTLSVIPAKMKFWERGKGSYGSRSSK